MIVKSHYRITLFVYAFNHEDYISNAIDAAFNQTYPKLEIILSDDCSTDRTFEIMQSKVDNFKGKHKVILNRNENNLGITGHLNKIMEIGSGDWFVLAAGDDISFLNRIEIIIEKINDYPEIMAINSGLDVIDQNGSFLRYHGFDKNRLYVTGASGAWNRKIFDFFGPITQPTTAEDIVIPFRAILLGKLLLLNEATIYYREHSNSISSPTNVSNIEAQKHLRKICFQILNACEQRLLDLDKVEINIEKPLYSSIRKKHMEVIKMLYSRIENIEKTITILESSLLGKIEYIFTSSPLNRHNTIVLRIKQVLLSFHFFEKLLIKMKIPKPQKLYTHYENDILIDLKQIDSQKDLLIYL